MKHLLTILFIVSILLTSCDVNLFVWQSNPPRVKLIVLNESELVDKTIGDTINLELGLELYNMGDLYFIDFEVYFDTTLFTPDSFNYEIYPSFFSIAGDSIPNDNGNFILDEDEEWVDINGNNVYDANILYPIGDVKVEPTFFDGGLGIPSPETNGGNVFGTGRVCEFYLSGIFMESTFNVNIIQALEYQNNETPIQHTINTWDVSNLLFIPDSLIVEDSLGVDF